MDRIDTLIRDLDRTSVSEERGVILDALTYAHASKWIDTATFHGAQKMLHVGAFLSAVLLLVPEGWWWKIETFSDGSYATTALKSFRGEKYMCAQQPPALALASAALKARRGA